LTRRIDLKKPIQQVHHIVYGQNDNPKKQKDITARLRKGVHRIAGLIRHHNYLTDEERWCLHLEIEMKRKWEEV
jgi:hypothetical protein